MAGTLTVTSMSNPYGDTPQQNTIVLDWLSQGAGAGAGTVSADICSTFAAAQETIHAPQPVRLKGYITSVETIPGKNGDLTTNVPTDAYDITLDNPYGCDLLGGLLSNRISIVAEKVVPSQPIPIDSEITLEIANAGNEKRGRIIIYIKPEV